MARTNHVKKFRGQRKCQWDVARVTVVVGGVPGRTGVTKCGLSRPEHTDEVNHPFTQVPLRCGSCGGNINIGDPYKWVAPRAYPGAPSSKKTRHVDCPGWKPSELTSSPHLSVLYGAQEAAAEEIGNTATPTTEDEIEGFKETLEAIAASCAEGAREAEESYGESADNIEDGFGHETYQSEELREKADSIAGYCDELDGYVCGDYDGEFVGDMDPEMYEDEDEMNDSVIEQLDTWAEAEKDELLGHVEEVPL